MAISLDSISNLNPQFQTAIKNVLKAESRPLENLTLRKENMANRVSLLDDLISRVGNVGTQLPNFRSANELMELAVTSTQERAISGTADKNVAEPGLYDVDVLQLASNASAFSNGFPDKDDTRIGSGFFAFTTANGDTKEVFIDNDNGTLEGIAKVINQSRVGMKASVVQDASNPSNPFRLVLKADGSGTSNDVEYPVFYFVDGEQDFFVEREHPATNARIRYEGLDFESPTNKIEDLIPGVTLNITGTTEGAAQIRIDNDIPKIIDKVKGLVDNVNSVLSFIQEQNTMDENTKTERTLGGQYSIRLTEDRFRRALQQNLLFSSSGRKIQSLNDMGIEFNRNGTLDLDAKKLENALDAHFVEVTELLVGDGRRVGIIPSLNTAIKFVATSRSGLLTAQRKNFQERVKGIQDDIDRKEAKIEKKFNRLKEQLTSAQNAISQMQNQTAFIGGGGASLPEQLLNF